MVRIGNLAHRIAGKTEYELSLFPLETVLFPGTPIHLHIFEPRYLAMIKRCLDENRPFGVTLIRRGQEAGAELAEPHPVGCTARIAAVDRLEDGRLNLTALGEERYRILELSYDLPYLVAKVEGLPINRPHSLEMLRSGRAAGRRAAPLPVRDHLAGPPD